MSGIWALPGQSSEHGICCLRASSGLQGYLGGAQQCREGSGCNTYAYSSAGRKRRSNIMHVCKSGGKVEGRFVMHEGWREGGVTAWHMRPRGCFLRMRSEHGICRLGARGGLQQHLGGIQQSTDGSGCRDICIQQSRQRMHKDRMKEGRVEGGKVGEGSEKGRRATAGRGNPSTPSMPKRMPLKQGFSCPHVRYVRICLKTHLSQRCQVSGDL